MGSNPAPGTTSELGDSRSARRSHSRDKADVHRLANLAGVAVGRFKRSGGWSFPRRSWIPPPRAAIQGSRVQSSGAVVVLTVPLLTSCAASMRCGRFRQEPSRTALRERRSEPVPRPKRPRTCSRQHDRATPRIAHSTAGAGMPFGADAWRAGVSFGADVRSRRGLQAPSPMAADLDSDAVGHNATARTRVAPTSTRQATPARAIESSVALLRRVRRAVASGTRTRAPREGETWQRR